MREDIDQSCAVEMPVTESGSYSESILGGGSPVTASAPPKGAGVRRKADVTPKRKKADMDELSEL
jgi:hypothetical protein